MSTTGAGAVLGSIDPNITTGNIGSGRGANTGFILPIQGSYYNLNTGGKLKQLEPMTIETFIQAAPDVNGLAGIATIKWETAPPTALTGGTLVWTIWGSATVFTASGYQTWVGKMPTTALFIRANITSYTSGYFTAYLKIV